MKELTEGIDRSQVAGIGFGGQMHGLVTLDKDDNVIRPAILWNDGRSQKETEYLNTKLEKINYHSTQQTSLLQDSQHQRFSG
mgnify:CR=1 FL=1